MMVLPHWVFVRIVIKQQKYNAVPRISFLQEIIAVLISYWIIYLPYSTAGSIKANTLTFLCILKVLGIDQVLNVRYIWMCWNSFWLSELWRAKRSVSLTPSPYRWGSWACEREAKRAAQGSQCVGGQSWAKTLTPRFIPRPCTFYYLPGLSWQPTWWEGLPCFV